MSKIGKINIAIPEKVKVVLNGNFLNIEGPLGKKSLNIDIEVDGGINNETGKLCVEAGANILVAGNYIFKETNDKYKDLINSLK